MKVPAMISALPGLFCRIAARKLPDHPHLGNYMCGNWRIKSLLLFIAQAAICDAMPLM
jgi:hypothetical protein